MAKKIVKRISRPAHLTPSQAARDRELRRKIEKEFPPIVRTDILPTLSEPLRRAITESPKPLDELAREAGVPESIVRRFVTGEGDLRLAAADQLAQVLGLRLVES